MRDLCEMSGFAATAAHVGEICDVIIDGVEETDHGLELIGHTWLPAPATGQPLTPRISVPCPPLAVVLGASRCRHRPNTCQFLEPKLPLTASASNTFPKH